MAKKPGSKRRVWSATLILVDRPSEGEKFLTKKSILDALKVKTGYAGVTPSVVDLKIFIK